MAEFRELFDAGDEEAFRVLFSGLQRHLHTSMIGIVSETSDGHSVSATPAVQQVIVDPTRTQTTYENYPLVMGMPAHYPGGGRTVFTHPFLAGDEILMHAASRAFGFWRQSGGNAQPETERLHSLSDCVAQGGVKSDPRRIQQVDTTAAHVRSVDKIHVSEMHPDRGHRTFSADPSTPPASPTFDPLSQAQKYTDHAVAGASGLLARAVTGGTTHDHGIDYAAGPFMRAANAVMSVLCHPTDGASLNAQNLLHKVTAGPLGAIMSAFGGKHTVSALASGVSLQSAIGISLSCPPSGLSLPSGGVSAGSLAAGAAAQNVGAVGGDLAGALPNPQVVGLGHANVSTLPIATSDAAAAAAGVVVGGLYVDTSIASGKHVVVMRAA